MTVFKSFLKVLYSCKFTILLNTIILIVFGALNMSTNETTISFTEEKPDVYIINHDEYKGITKNLIDYIKENSEIKEIENNESALRDAIFYRDVNYIIEIPEHFREDFLNGKNPKIITQTTGDYLGSLANLTLERYMKTALIYQSTLNDEKEIIENIDKTLNDKINVETTTKLDTGTLSKASFYFNFASYTLLASAVYVVCLILSSFKEPNVHKRTIISSMNYKKFNRQLFLSNCLFGIVLWIFYIILAYMLVGDIIFSSHGLCFMLNSLIFVICALSISFLIGSLVRNKEAINGIVNVIALGSSFLCGAFVPVEYLPESVLKIAHILPTYWYINSNNRISSLEKFDFISLKPLLSNIVIILIFVIIFMILTNIISKRKRIVG